MQRDSSKTNPTAHTSTLPDDRTILVIAKKIIDYFHHNQSAARLLLTRKMHTDSYPCFSVDRLSLTSRQYGHLYHKYLISLSGSRTYSSPILSKIRSLFTGDVRIIVNGQASLRFVEERFNECQKFDQTLLSHQTFKACAEANVTKALQHLFSQQETFERNLIYRGGSVFVLVDKEAKISDLRGRGYKIDEFLGAQLIKRDPCKICKSEYQFRQRVMREAQETTVTPERKTKKKPKISPMETPERQHKLKLGPTPQQPQHRRYLKTQSKIKSAETYSAQHQFESPSRDDFTPQEIFSRESIQQPETPTFGSKISSLLRSKLPAQHPYQHPSPYNRNYSESYSGQYAPSTPITPAQSSLMTTHSISTQDRATSTYVSKEKLSPIQKHSPISTNQSQFARSYGTAIPLISATDPQTRTTAVNLSQVGIFGYPQPMPRKVGEVSNQERLYWVTLGDDKIKLKIRMSSAYMREHYQEILDSSVNTQTIQYREDNHGIKENNSMKIIGKQQKFATSWRKKDGNLNNVPVIQIKPIKEQQLGTTKIQGKS